jgi:hypothetical protein
MCIIYVTLRETLAQKHKLICLYKANVYTGALNKTLIRLQFNK